MFLLGLRRLESARRQREGRGASIALCLRAPSSALDVVEAHPGLDAAAASTAFASNSEAQTTERARADESAETIARPDIALEPLPAASISVAAAPAPEEPVAARKSKSGRRLRRSKKKKSQETGREAANDHVVVASSSPHSTPGNTTNTLAAQPPQSILHMLVEAGQNVDAARLSLVVDASDTNVLPPPLKISVTAPEKVEATSSGTSALSTPSTTMSSLFAPSSLVDAPTPRGHVPPPSTPFNQPRPASAEPPSSSASLFLPPGLPISNLTSQGPPLIEGPTSNPISPEFTPYQQPQFHHFHQQPLIQPYHQPQTLYSYGCSPPVHNLFPQNQPLWPQHEPSLAHTNAYALNGMPPDGMYQHSYVANPDFFPLEPTAFVMGPPYPPQESFLFAQASTSHSHAFTPVHLQQLQHPLAPPPGLFPRPSPPAPANAATFDAFVSAPAAISGPRLIETETSQRMYSPSGYGPTPYAPRAVGSSYIEVAMSPARKSSFGTIGQNRSGALTAVEGAQPRDSGWSLF